MLLLGYMLYLTLIFVLLLNNRLQTLNVISFVQKFEKANDKISMVSKSNEN